MALGGGTFLVQNKVLPGSYINFISAKRASATLSDRGFAAMPLILDWGCDNEVFTVEVGDFQKDSLKIFGYDYTSDKLKGLRDIFLNCKTLYAYRLNSGQKAQCNIAYAKYSGIKGNDLKIDVSKNADDTSKFDITTIFNDKDVDLQTVSKADELLDNDYVTFKKDAVLSVGKLNFTGGTNKDEVSGNDFQEFLNKIESYSFNTLGCPSSEDTIKSLFISFTKRMRDDVGVKFQTVIYNKSADYEGIINLKNPVIGDDEYSLVYWLTGAASGCAVNRSNTNKVYDGEFEIKSDFSQTELTNSIKNGQFVFHKVGDEIRVLEDVNSFVSVTVDKNDDFQSNQVIRVLDQIGNDIAVLFNSKYLGKVQNNNAGRIAFWGDIVVYNKQLEQIQAIENYSSEDTVVEKGDDKKSVVVTNPVTPVAAMSKLYMTVVVE